MITTTDFFFPLIDDPFVQGKIACANVLSDMYSMGVVHIDTMLMLLAGSQDMEKKERDIVMRLMIEGFNEQAKLAGTSVTGGQTVRNPWPIIGGVATSVVSETEYIMPTGAKPGDVLVLTKPLGIQVAGNLHQWKSMEEKWKRVKDLITVEEVDRAYNVAMASMSRLNKNGAILMHKYKAHAATDVTGFGILGHGKNLAQNQIAAVDFEIHTLPVILNMDRIDNQIKAFNLAAGLAAETSGGLLIAMAPEQAELYCAELESLEKWPAWIIGNVVENPSNDPKKNMCRISQNPKFINY